MRRIQRVLFGLFLGLVVIVSAVYMSITALVLVDAVDSGPWQLLGAGVLLAFVLLVGGALLRGGFSRPQPSQHIHHSFDPVDVRNPR